MRTRDAGCACRANANSHSTCLLVHVEAYLLVLVLVVHCRCEPAAPTTAYCTPHARRTRQALSRAPSSRHTTRLPSSQALIGLHLVEVGDMCVKLLLRYLLQAVSIGAPDAAAHDQKKTNKAHHDAVCMGHTSRPAP